MMSSTTPNLPKIAAVILNYNNWQQTIECIKSLLKIKYPNFLIIVVDNASQNNSLEMIRKWARSELSYFTKTSTKFTCPTKIPIIEYTSEEIKRKAFKNELEYSQDSKIIKLILISSDENSGYSGGNNLGIIYAIEKQCDAVLILNPDVQIDDENFLNILSETLFSRDQIVVVGPRIYGLDGKQQSPIKEPNFLEELLYPLLKVEFVVNTDKLEEPIVVDKVHGCCFLAKTAFLKKVCLLDENVFLFSEETILSYKAKKYGGVIVFEPRTSALHKHTPSPAKPLFFKIALKSRLYVLRKYKEYTGLKYSLLTLKYYINYFLYLTKDLTKRVI